MDAAPSAVRLMVTSVPTEEVLYGVVDAGSPEAVVSTCQRACVPHQWLPHAVARIATAVRKSSATFAIETMTLRSGARS